MTASVIQAEADGDPVLLTRVRAGDSTAYAELFSRHRGPALAFALRLAGVNRADDLVAEAFAKVLSALQRDLGPTVSFRAYLLATIRSLHVNGIRTESRYTLVEDYDTVPAEPLMVEEDPSLRFDIGAIGDAYRALPERWQAVLWYGTVEGRTNDEIGVLLGLKPNAVAQLSYRAREGLRQAYLKQHLAVTVDEQCRDILALLPAYVRGSIDRRKKSRVEEHLRGCPRCSAALVDLDGVNDRLGVILLPIVLGAGASRIGWPDSLGGGRRLALRLASEAGVKAIAAITAAVITVGVPLTWHALRQGSAPSRATSSKTAMRSEAITTVPGELIRPWRHGRTLGSDRDHASSSDALAVPASRAPEPDEPAARLSPGPSTRPSASAPTARPRHTTGSGSTSASALVASPAATSAANPSARTTNDLSVGKVVVTALAPVGTRVAVPLTNVLPQTVVYLTFAGLGSAPILSSAGWTCSMSGTPALGSLTSTCTYGGPSTATTTLGLTAATVGLARVTVAAHNPGGVTDPVPANNTASADVM